MKVFAIVATLLAGSAMAAQQAAAPKADAANAPTFGNLLDIMSKVVEAIGERVPELQSDAASVSASLDAFKQSAASVKVGSLVGEAGAAASPK
ncbi:unnamed protein product [Clonostachys rhizophaga]|uniref:Uncharacterized protein n=1 Tax=Clonostachys rhizophaga TaxID=160324 RepID=A0A9N9V6H2_9HYPO|nr:unnamed protein product [Clonostachys rhizophaga]